MSEPIRTYVDAGEGGAAAMDRDGFVSVCRYGSMVPEPNEIGAIVRAAGDGHFEQGLFVQPVECIERIFIRQQEGIGGA